MITFSKIGKFGRLGNQLFQFASTFGIARKMGYEVKFPSENMFSPSIEDFKDGIRREVTFDIPKCFNVPEDLLCPIDEIRKHVEWGIQEPHFHFSDIMFDIPDNMDLIGYYQTDKYFSHCEEELRKVLTFRNDLNVDKFFLDQNTVSIHVRVGDYAGLQEFHPVCEPDYYESALNHFLDKDYLFVIFSDDINYAHEIFGDQGNIKYADPDTDFNHLQLMSLCKHNIIANSSFSWWGAWLNKNPEKRVIAPQKWFGPAYDGVHNTKDLYCEGWIKE